MFIALLGLVEGKWIQTQPPAPSHNNYTYQNTVCVFLNK